VQFGRDPAVAAVSTTTSGTHSKPCLATTGVIAASALCNAGTTLAAIVASTESDIGNCP
jgi:hypothetical protein